MPEFFIEISNLDRLVSEVESFEDILRILRNPMQESLYLLESIVKKYPPPIPEGLWAATTSARVKRAFFASLGNRREGRTGTLGRRWLTDIDQTVNGLIGKIGNNTEYGPWVQSDQFQVAFHRGRWTTDAQALEANLENILRIFERGIERQLP